MGKIDSFSQVSGQKWAKIEKKTVLRWKEARKLKMRFWAKIDSFSQVSSHRMDKNKKIRIWDRKLLRNRKCDFGQK